MFACRKMNRKFHASSRNPCTPNN